MLRASAGSPRSAGCVDVALPRTGVSDSNLQRGHEPAPPRMVLTTRAVAWATGALSYDDTTVSALARHLGVDCMWPGTRSRWRRRPVPLTLPGSPW